MNESGTQKKKESGIIFLNFESEFREVICFLFLLKTFADKLYGLKRYFIVSKEYISTSEGKFQLIKVFSVVIILLFGGQPRPVGKCLGRR